MSHRRRRTGRRRWNRKQGKMRKVGHLFLISSSHLLQGVTIRGNIFQWHQQSSFNVTWRSVMRWNADHLWGN